MLPPTKKMYIYRELKQAIRRGDYPPGVFLPNELELAGKFAVARETLRGALKMLADEQLIERIQSRGTLVCGCVQAPLTFLTACPGFFDKCTDTPSVIKGHELLDGISQGAFDNGRRIETIPMSPTNEPDNIDITPMAHLNENSLVIMNGAWGYRLFDFLDRRNCRVALRIGERELDMVSAYRHKWLIAVENNISLMDEAVRQICLRGCERVALAYWDNLFMVDNHPILRGFRQAMRRRGLDDSRCQAFSSDESVPCRMREFYDQDPFDGLLLAPLLRNDMLTSMRRINAAYNLPDDVKIISLLDMAGHVAGAENISGFSYPSGRIGYDFVERLLDRVWRPGVYYCDAVFTEREQKNYCTGN